MKILFQFVFFVLIFSACSPSGDAANQNKVLEYSKIVKANKAHGLDVRTVREYSNNGSKLADNIPIMELSKRMNELDKNKTIFVFCESGGRSLVAKKLLQINGFNMVINIQDWRTWEKIVKAGT